MLSPEDIEKSLSRLVERHYITVKEVPLNSQKIRLWAVNIQQTSASLALECQKALVTLVAKFKVLSAEKGNKDEDDSKKIQSEMDQTQTAISNVDRLYMKLSFSAFVDTL